MRTRHGSACCWICWPETTKPRMAGLCGWGAERSASQCFEGAGGDFFDAAGAADGTVLGRCCRVLLGPARVVVNQRAGLVAVDVQALLDGFFLVVVALHQRFASHIVLAFDLGRVELDVVGT